MYYSTIETLFVRLPNLEQYNIPLRTPSLLTHLLFTIRQEVIMQELGSDELYIDKASVKNTDRLQLKKMLSYVRRGDTVIVESISHFARNRPP